MDKDVQKLMAEFIVKTKFAQIRPNFVLDAKYRIIDWLGCAVCGVQYKQAEIARAYINQTGGSPEATVMGTKIRYPVLSAAFVNGIIGHVSELDDGHRKAIGHPGSVTLPVAIAVGEKLQVTGEEFLAAVIIGYEIFIRMGQAVNPSHYKYWHTTGTCGTFAAMAVAASMMKLSLEETVNAIGIAGTIASGLTESFGAHAKALNIGQACENGIKAAKLAKMGFTGAKSILTGKKGFLKAYSEEKSWNILDSFSVDTLISDTGFYKVYASCGHTNSPLDIIFNLLTQGSINTKDIASILVETYKISVDITKDLKTETEDQAKFSLPYVLAVALLKKQVTLNEFTPEMLKDREILTLAKKITVQESSNATKNFPKRQAKLTIIFKDGRTLVSEVDDAHDMIDYPKIEGKFLGLTSMLEAGSSEKVMDVIKHLEQKKDIVALIEYMQKF